jgi:hypothetical protein
MKHLILLLSLSLLSLPTMATDNPNFSFERKINLESGPANAEFKILSSQYAPKNSVFKCHDKDYSFFRLIKENESCTGGKKELIQLNGRRALCFSDYSPSTFYEPSDKNGECHSSYYKYKASYSSLPQYHLSRKLITPVKVVNVTKSQLQCFQNKVKYFKKFVKKRPELDIWLNKINIEFTMSIAEESTAEPKININKSKVVFDIRYDKSKKGNECIDIPYDVLKDKNTTLTEENKQKRLAEIEAEKERKLAAFRERNRKSIVDGNIAIVNELFSVLDNDANNPPNLDKDPAQVADSQTQKEQGTTPAASTKEEGTGSINETKS